MRCWTFATGIGHLGISHAPGEVMPHAVIVVQEARRDKLDRMGFTFVRLQFAQRVAECLNHRVVLYQSRSDKYEPGYFATATLIDAGVYVLDERLLYIVVSDLQLLEAVRPLSSFSRIIESRVRKPDGSLHGRRFSDDFRMIGDDEFEELTSASLYTQVSLQHAADGYSDEAPFRTRIERTQWARDAEVRSRVLLHFHYRWDNGIIDILDDYTWVPIGLRQDEIVANWKGPRKLFMPKDSGSRLSPESLIAHRKEVRSRSGVVDWQEGRQV